VPLARCTTPGLLGLFLPGSGDSVCARAPASSRGTGSGSPIAGGPGRRRASGAGSVVCGLAGWSALRPLGRNTHGEFTRHRAFSVKKRATKKHAQTERIPWSGQHSARQCRWDLPSLANCLFAGVRSCAKENLWCSPALSLASRDLAGFGQLPLRRSSLKKSQRKRVPCPRFAGQA